MIAQEGFEVNHKKVRPIYTEEKLQVRRRGGRKRALVGYEETDGAARRSQPTLAAEFRI